MNEGLPVMDYVRQLEEKVREKNDEIESWKRAAVVAAIHNGMFWIGMGAGAVVTGAIALVIRLVRMGL